MKITVTALVLFLAWGAAAPGRASGRLAEVSLVDRDTGHTVEAYYRHGEYWVAGEPGARYAISLHNRLGERLLAVISVDGVNVITGQSAGWDQAGYVLDPWEAYQVSGWRKSDYQVAAFAFTAAPRSYAARTGRPENVGVIGIALFREQPTSAALSPEGPPIAGVPPEGGRPEGASRAPAPSARAQSEGAASPSAPTEESKSFDFSANSTLAMPLARPPALGTAHGEREYSYVEHTSFLRRHSRPDEIIRVRYDSLANLIAMGIVRPHHYHPLQPNPFPGTEAESYVPDPPPAD